MKQIPHEHIRTTIIFFSMSIFFTYIPLICGAGPGNQPNEIVKVGTISFPQLVQSNDQNNVQTVTYANRFFSTTPNLLFGIKEIELEVSSISNVNFQLIPSDNTFAGFKLTLSKVGPVKIQKLIVTYSASSAQMNLYTYRGDFDFNSNIASNNGSKVIASQTFSYMQTYNSSTQNRVIQAFITGIERTFASPADPNNKFSIFLEVVQNGSNFNINFVCNDNNYSAANKIKRVSFNYIEFIEEKKINAYIVISQFIDTTYLSTVGKSIASSPGSVRDEEATIQYFKIFEIGDIFTGLSGIQSSSSSDFLRMKTGITKMISGTVTFTYTTYGNTLIEGVTTGFVLFGMVSCDAIPATKYFDDTNQQCVDSCPGRSIQKIPGDSRTQCVLCAQNCFTCYGPEENNCQTCQPTFKYFLKDKCTAEQPDSTYCDPSTFKCKNCIQTSCSRCESDLNVCKICEPTFYIYNYQCYNPPPAETYCDNTKMECKDCLKECKTCSNGTSCDSCHSPLKFYKNQCPVICPTTTYSDANDICQKCPSECTSCTNPTTCQSCKFGYYWYKSFCEKVLPPHTFCDTQLYCYDCDPLCNTCSISSTQCDSCYANKPYLYQQNCYATQPTNTGCPSANGGLFYNCSTCPQKCETCNEKFECLSCSAGSTYPYFYRSDCLQSLPQGAFCDITTNVCEKCPSACGSCVGSSTKQCIDCAENFVKVTRSDGTSECKCKNKFKRFDSKQDQCVWKDAGISADTVVTVSDTLQATSYSAEGLSIFFAVASRFTKSGLSMISNAFLVQKIFYMRLANVDKPYFFLQFLKSLDNGGILPKYKSWNIFKGIDSDAAIFPPSSSISSSSNAAVTFSHLNHSKSSGINTLSSSSNSYSNEITQSSSQGELLMDYHFQDAELSAAIFVNVGGVFVAIIVILLVHLVFAFIVKNDTKSNAFYVYAMFICGSMVQMLPLITFVLFDSFFLELSQISAVIDYYGVFGGIFLLLLIAAIMLFIFILLGLVFAKGTTSTLNPSEVSGDSSSGFSMNLLMREVEMNLKRDTIQNKMIQRTYLIVFYAVECIVFPLITVMLRSSFQAAGIIVIVIQVSLLVFTIVVRPFYINLINVQFALEQLCLLISQIAFVWLAFVLDGLSMEEEEVPSSIIVLSLICLAFALLGIIVNPVIQGTVHQLRSLRIRNDRIDPEVEH